MDPELQKLLAQQQREESVLFDQFRRANPTLQIDVQGVDCWPEDKEAEYAALTADLRAKHKAEREALATAEL